MSTAGRISKGGPKFQPRRPTANSASARPVQKDSSIANTPQQPSLALPQLDEVEVRRDAPLPTPGRPTTSRVSTTQHDQLNRSRRSAESAFGPSDPSLRLTQSRAVPSPSSSAFSQPPSSFGFTDNASDATQATSAGPSSQAPPSTHGETEAGNVAFGSGSQQLGSGTQTSSIEQRTIPATAKGQTISRKMSGKEVDRTTGKAKGKGQDHQVEGQEADASTQAPVDDTQIDTTQAIGNDQPGRNDAGDPHLASRAGTQRSRRTPTTPAVPTLKSSQKRAIGAGAVDEGESEDEWDKMKPKKRRAKKVPKKRGKVDEMLFDDGDDSDEAGPPASGEDQDGSEGEQNRGGSRQPSSKRSKKAGNPRADEPLPAVDPSQTTMSQLADPNPGVELGRPSERTLFFEKQKVDKRAAMKLKRQKMKARQKRRDLGQRSDTDAGDDEESEGNGLDGGARAEDKQVTPGEHQHSSVSRATSPQALDAAEAMALIGGLRPDELGSDGDEIADKSKGSRDVEDGQGVGDEDGQGVGDEDDDGYDDLVETTYAPQMRIVDGKLVIDEDSLQIDRSKPTDTGPREVVEESAQDRFVNSRSFSKKPGKAKKWDLDETERFYDALSQFGTDFELISALFPGRSRREIKLKWTKEDKLSPKKITAALMQRKKIDLVSYAKISGHDLTGPTPADPMDEINERRAKLEAEGHATGNANQRRGGEGAQAGDRKLKGKKKRGAIDEAGAALFDDEAIAREQEEEDRRRLEAEQEEEERQARIDALEAEGE